MTQRPADCFTKEELGVVHSHLAVGEQAVRIRPVFEHQLMKDRSPSDPDVVGFDPQIHLLGEFGVRRDHGSRGVNGERVDRVPPRCYFDPGSHSG